MQRNLLNPSPRSPSQSGRFRGFGDERPFRQAGSLHSKFQKDVATTPLRRFTRSLFERLESRGYSCPWRPFCRDRAVRRTGHRRNSQRSPESVSGPSGRCPPGGGAPAAGTRRPPLRPGRRLVRHRPAAAHARTGLRHHDHRGRADRGPVPHPENPVGGSSGFARPPPDPAPADRPLHTHPPAAPPPRLHGTGRRGGPRPTAAATDGHQGSRPGGDGPAPAPRGFPPRGTRRLRTCTTALPARSHSFPGPLRAARAGERRNRMSKSMILLDRSISASRG